MNATRKQLYVLVVPKRCLSGGSTKIRMMAPAFSRSCCVAATPLRFFSSSSNEPPPRDEENTSPKPREGEEDKLFSEKAKRSRQHVQQLNEQHDRLSERRQKSIESTLTSVFGAPSSTSNLSLHDSSIKMERHFVATIERAMQQQQQIKGEEQQEQSAAAVVGEERITNVAADQQKADPFDQLLQQMQEEHGTGQREGAALQQQHGQQPQQPAFARSPDEPPPMEWIQAMRQLSGMIVSSEDLEKRKQRKEGTTTASKPGFTPSAKLPKLRNVHSRDDYFETSLEKSGRLNNQQLRVILSAKERGELFAYPAQTKAHQEKQEQGKEEQRPSAAQDEALRTYATKTGVSEQQLQTLLSYYSLPENH
ncbi:hypothetical protein QOT17_000932 [Balamuthia mandrillaris]